MSLNHITLKPYLVASLYDHTLVEEVQSDARFSVNYIGKNRKHILVLVRKADAAYIDDEELQFLSSVLAACKLSVEDIAIVNGANLPAGADYLSLLRFFESRHILLFDVAPQTIDLPFNFPHFQLQQFDQHTYLSAPALKEIKMEKDLKTKLWNSLKMLFNI
ncbi:MAG TPA: hypothetical protein VM935_06955 [Chitinophagaceae bacterium]|nr:hypothetical protein [Chitinophagaceae bacterium]